MTEKQMLETKEFTEKDMEALRNEVEGLPRCFNKIKTILKRYMDMKEEYYSLVSLWIIGTYFHRQFRTYPYLYFNATKGSGKSRILNIITTLSKEGMMAGALTEATLFRTKGTLGLDEFEHINEKGKENLADLLNSAYKKGLVVPRMSGKDKDVVKLFDVFRPIAICNIRGLDNILQDRCISIIIEKSAKKEITRIIENFENEMEFKTARGSLMNITEKLQKDFKEFAEEITGGQTAPGIFDNLVSEWNNQIWGLEFADRYKEFFEKIGEEINSRDLELFFPLFIIADMISNKVLNEVIEISKKVIKERKEQDKAENTDVKIQEFFSQYENTGFVSVSSLVKEFREFQEIPDKDEWANAKWFGRRLKTLALVIENRRVGRGMEVRINLDKAKEQFKRYEEPDFEKELQGVLNG